MSPAKLTVRHSCSGRGGLGLPVWGRVHRPHSLRGQESSGVAEGELATHGGHGGHARHQLRPGAAGQRHRLHYGDGGEDGAQVTQREHLGRRDRVCGAAPEKGKHRHERHNDLATLAAETVDRFHVLGIKGGIPLNRMQGREKPLNCNRIEVSMQDTLTYYPWKATKIYQQPKKWQGREADMYSFTDFVV